MSDLSEAERYLIQQMNRIGGGAVASADTPRAGTATSHASTIAPGASGASGASADGSPNVGQAFVSAALHSATDSLPLNVEHAQDPIGGAQRAQNELQTMIDSIFDLVPYTEPDPDDFPTSLGPDGSKQALVQNLMKTVQDDLQSFMEAYEGADVAEKENMLRTMSSRLILVAHEMEQFLGWDSLSPEAREQIIEFSGRLVDIATTDFGHQQAPMSAMPTNVENDQTGATVANGPNTLPAAKV